MGKRPIRAGMTALTTRASVERREKRSTSLAMCPDLSISLLITRINPTMEARPMV
jgi:hypothetical protein